jgi:hypothetical protein
VRGTEFCLLLSFPVSLLFSLPESSHLLAYGPAPGVELIPYFLGLVAWMGVAFATVLLWPLSALLRRFRRARRAEETGPSREPLATSAPESSGQGSHDTV